MNYPKGVKLAHFYSDKGHFIGGEDSIYKNKTWEYFEAENDIIDIQFCENSYGSHVLAIYKPRNN